MDKSRLSWAEYALGLATAASQRSEDPFVKVGACALNSENMVLGVGYNGLASGKDVDWGFFSRDERRPVMLHAEMNCLSLCKKGDVNLLAVTLLPCSHCAAMIAGYGIPTVVYHEEYKQDEGAKEIFEFYGIKLCRIWEPLTEEKSLSERRKVPLEQNDKFKLG